MWTLTLDLTSSVCDPELQSQAAQRRVPAGVIWFLGGAHQSLICTILWKKKRPINKIQKVTKPNLSTLFEGGGCIQSRGTVRSLSDHCWLDQSQLLVFTVHTRVGRAQHRLSLEHSHWLCHSGRAPPSPVYKASLAGGVNLRLPLMVSVAAPETLRNTLWWASLVPRHRF